MPSRETIAQRRQLAKQRDFLADFEASGSVLSSAKQAGVSRQLVYYWRKTCPSFERRLSAAADLAFGASRPIPIRRQNQQDGFNPRRSDDEHDRKTLLLHACESD
tara:strand:+ start:405 stop:719 length:315 start_codon:yes stop_codon:yes gene_type:complete